MKYALITFLNENLIISFTSNLMTSYTKKEKEEELSIELNGGHKHNN